MFAVTPTDSFSFFPLSIWDSLERLKISILLLIALRFLTYSTFSNISQLSSILFASDWSLIFLVKERILKDLLGRVFSTEFYSFYRMWILKIGFFPIFTILDSPTLRVSSWRESSSATILLILTPESRYEGTAFPLPPCFTVLIMSIL